MKSVQHGFWFGYAHHEPLGSEQLAPLLGKELGQPAWAVPPLPLEPPVAPAPAEPPLESPEVLPPQAAIPLRATVIRKGDRSRRCWAKRCRPSGTVVPDASQYPRQLSVCQRQLHSSCRS